MKIFGVNHVEGALGLALYVLVSYAHSSNQE